MNKYINKIFLTSVITLAGMLGATSCTELFGQISI